MTSVQSFAPLAGRLAAKAAEIRPAAGAEISWANFMALFFCAIFEMLILLCEALDARAAADARDMAAPASRAGRAAAAGDAQRNPRRARTPTIRAMPSKQPDALAGTAKPTPQAPRLVWSRDASPGLASAVPTRAPPWQFVRETRPGRPGDRLAYFVTIS